MQVKCYNQYNNLMIPQKCLGTCVVTGLFLLLFLLLPVRIFSTIGGSAAFYFLTWTSLNMVLKMLGFQKLLEHTNIYLFMFQMIA